MPLQPFGAWAPDAVQVITDASQEQNVAGEALGVLPDVSSYRPWAAPASASTAVAAAVRGASAVRITGNGVTVFCGTATKLYKFGGSVSAAWTDFSGGSTYALAADDCWKFIQSGSTVIALDGVDPPLVTDVNVGTSFAALGGSPPTAKYGVKIGGGGGQLMLGNTGNSSREVFWGGRNNDTWWTPGQLDCDHEIFPDGGDIMGLSAIEIGGVVYQTDCIRQVFADSSRMIYQFHRVAESVGTRSPESIIPYQGGGIYYSTRGFMQAGLDGTATPIGRGYVDEWFLANSNVKTRPKAVIGALAIGADA